MPGTDMPLEKLRAYRGSFPCPGDFVSFWDAVQKELAALDPAPVLERVELPNAWGTHARVTIRAMDGCLLRAKYIRPVGADPVPGVLQFHDYPDASRSWFHLTRYLAVGRAVLAPDCRGQGGMSENGSRAWTGTCGSCICSS